MWTSRDAYPPVNCSYLSLQFVSMCRDNPIKNSSCLVEMIWIRNSTRNFLIEGFQWKRNNHKVATKIWIVTRASARNFTVFCNGLVMLSSEPNQISTVVNIKTHFLLVIIPCFLPFFLFDESRCVVYTELLSWLLMHEWVELEKGRH